MALKHKEEINKNKLKAKRKKNTFSRSSSNPTKDGCDQGEAEVEVSGSVSVCPACFSSPLLRPKKSPALLRSWSQALTALNPALTVRQALRRKKNFIAFFSWLCCLQNFYQNISSFKLLLRYVFRQWPRALWVLTQTSRHSLGRSGTLFPEPPSTLHPSLLYSIFSTFWKNVRSEPRIPQD